MSRTRSALPILIPVIFLLLSGCGDDDPAGPGVSFDLTFTGDASFHQAHGGDAIHVFVENSGGVVVAADDGTVSDSQEPAFSFTFENALEEGESYVLKYWIDSNFGDGTQGQCDAPEVDHQWRLAIGTASEDVTLDDSHRPGETEAVCSSSEDPGEPGY